ncbi:MAG TPA: acyl-CoA reductase [Bacteroidia bacterium]|nr:acyl-CoA reductase [Bacteroidia bacterium]HRH07911.1 acyl-CoA reductase [Bacteroidia bacterium]
MKLNQRVAAFAKLGIYLHQLASNEKNDTDFRELNELYYSQAQQLFASVKLQNGWFTETNVRNSILAIAEMLQEKHLVKWVSNYPLSESSPSKRIGIVMAGNIPLVGFHDFLSVVISGNCAVMKLSSDDALLLPLVVKILSSIEPGFMSQVDFSVGGLKNIDAVIATGSGNTARYFEYYFSKMPSLIRKNRNSLAVLDGNEKPEELTKLGDDIFSYFGLGCRNVSKLFIPQGYDLDRFFKAIYSYSELINHNKYANNFDYNRAVYLMGKDKEGLLENGFLFLVKSNEYASPVAVLFYEYYDSAEQLNRQFETDREKIQCIVSNSALIKNCIPLGSSQRPQLWEYADNVDTLQFLVTLK